MVGKAKLVLIFTLYGFVGYFFFLIFVIGAEDILAGTNIPSSSVTLTEAIFGGIGFFICSFFLVRNVSFMLKYSLAVILTCCSLLLLYLVHNIYWKLVSIGGASLGYSIGHITGIELSSQYGRIALSSLALGTGLSHVLGPLYYIVMSTWLCVPVNLLCLIPAPFIFVYPLGYLWLQPSCLPSQYRMVQSKDWTSNEEIDKETLSPQNENNKDLKSFAQDVEQHKVDNAIDKNSILFLKEEMDLGAKQGGSRQGSTKKTGNREVFYEMELRDISSKLERGEKINAIEESGNDSYERRRNEDMTNHHGNKDFTNVERDDDKNHIFRVKSNYIEDNHNILASDDKVNRDDENEDFGGNSNNPDKYLCWEEKLDTIRSVLKNLVFMACVIFLEFISSQGVITTLSFPNAPFPPREHYIYYQTSTYSGQALGRSYLFIASFIGSNAFEMLRIRNIWKITVIKISLTSFLICSAMYRFLPSVYLVICAVFISGFLNGSNVVNMLFILREADNSDFALSLLESTASTSIVLGSLAAGLVESWLYNSCIDYYQTSGLTELCLTRAKNASLVCHQ